MFITEVCTALDNDKVNYAIVGGYAVALHGAPRGTIDVDIVLSWSLKNLRAAENALNNIGLKSQLPLNAEMMFNFRDEYIHNRNLVAWNFIDDSNPIRQVDIIITYKLNSNCVTKIKSKTGNLKVLKKEALIKMKKESNRSQDLEDIKALEKL